MLQLNQKNDIRRLLRLHVKLSSDYTVLGEIPLNVNLKQRHHLRITVSGQTITT